MTLKDIVEQLDLTVLAGEAYLDRDVDGAYAADLLSCVMAGAKAGQLWFTLQTHLNTVAVASLLELSGIVVTEGAPVPEETIAKAQEEKMVLLLSEAPTFETIAKLVRLGF